MTTRQIGRYLIGRKLGSGGAATVYQAYDQVQGRSVALKVLLPGADDVTRFRFRQEARTAGALRHPNIVATLQVGDAPADGMAYIAMQLIEGESLARLLERRGKLLPEESCNLLTPIAYALAHAHQSGVIHRDVKPSNILLRPASPGAVGSVQLEALDHPVVPLLSDFGIARALDMPELTNVGRTIGTPAYMAPEQCTGSREVTAQSDIYSLGAVLYRCLVGRAPFLGSTTQILHAHVYEAVTIPDDILAALPPRVVDVLRISLAKQAGDRYGSALNLAEALTLAAGRSLPVARDETETTSTLTLASLSPVSPPPLPPGAETVIVSPSSLRPARQPATTGLPPLPTHPVVNESRRRWPRIVAASAGIAALVLMGVALLSAGTNFPYAHLFGPAEQAAASSAPLVLGSTTMPGSVGESTPPTPAAPTAQATVAPIALAPTPQPSDTPTSRPLPTATPLPAPTARPTTAPVASPTTAIALEPTAEPTATDEMAVACQYVAMEELYDYLRQEGRAEKLGCATDQGKPIDFEVQPFQNGLMLRRDDTQAIYVRFAGNGQWEQHPDHWDAGKPPAPTAPELAPPSPGLFTPERGIGLLWTENNVVRNTLGWATAPATVTSGVVQTFDGGLLIRDMQADGQVIYEFLKSLFRF